MEKHESAKNQNTRTKKDPNQKSQIGALCHLKILIYLELGPDSYRDGSWNLA